MIKKAKLRVDRKAKLDFDKKNAQLRVEEKKKKKKGMTLNTALPPTRRKSQHTKLDAAGMTAVQPLGETKNQNTIANKLYENKIIQNNIVPLQKNCKEYG